MPTLSSIKKNILVAATKSVVFVILLIVVFSPLQELVKIPTAHAFDICYKPGAERRALTNGQCPPGYETKDSTDPNAQDTLAGKIEQTNRTPTPPSDGLTCSLSDIGSCLANIVYVFTVGLGSGLAYVGAFVFDTTVALSLNSAAYALSFLSSGWTTARDLANMGFILILVYIAFMIMFQAETTGTIRTLAQVIFIALIINFSFFLTRVVIDTGNILAVQFYNSIQAPTLQSTINVTDSRTGALAGTAATVTGSAANYLTPGTLANTKDLTASIMDALNIQKLFDNKTFQAFAKDSSFGSKLIILSFLYIAIGAAYFILAVMFLSVGIKFLMRIVVLWFLIIAAPLAFIAKAVPNKGVSVYYDRWQHELVIHTFYPAIFLFIFFFIYTIMSSLTGDNSLLGGLAKDLLDAQSQNTGGLIYIASAISNVAIRLGFVIAMLYIALKASDYIGVRGAGAAHAVTGWVTKNATGAAFNTLGWAGRSTAGRAGYIASRSNLVNDLAASRGIGGTLIGRPLKAAFAGLGRSTYDMRGVGGVKSTLAKVGIETEKPGGKGGFEGVIKARAENIEKRAKEFKDVNEVQLEKAQAKYEADYDKEKGIGAYDARVKTLDDQKKSAQQAAKDAQAQIDAAKLVNDSEARKTAEKALRDAKTREKDADNALKPLKEGGKKTLEDASKARVQSFADRMGKRNWQNLGFIPGPATGPSRGSLAGAAKAIKLVNEKGNTEKLADVVKDIQKEAGETPEAAAVAPATETVAGGGAAQPQAEQQHHTQAYAAGDERAEIKRERQQEKQTEVLREALSELRKTGRANEHGFSSLVRSIEKSSKKTSEVLHTLHTVDTAFAQGAQTKPAPSAQDIAKEASKLNTVKASAPQPPKAAPAPIQTQPNPQTPPPAQPTQAVQPKQTPPATDPDHKDQA